MDLIEQHQIQDKIVFYTKDVHPWENDAHLLSLSKEDYSRFEIDFLSRKILKKYKNYNTLLPPIIQTTCMATSNGKSELVDVNGNLFTCNEFPYIERLLEYSVGNIFEGKTKQETYGLETWYEKIEQNYNNKCLSCNLLPICGGHCPKHWIDKKHLACPSIKFNIEDKVKLQYLTNGGTN